MDHLQHQGREILIWRVCQEWMILKWVKAAGVRRCVMEWARGEIVLGCYDAEEVSRRLRRKELTVALPSLVFPLLRLRAS
jgi:hypothetical protein